MTLSAKLKRGVALQTAAENTVEFYVHTDSGDVVLAASDAIKWTKNEVTVTKQFQYTNACELIPGTYDVKVRYTGDQNRQKDENADGVIKLTLAVKSLNITNLTGSREYHGQKTISKETLTLSGAKFDSVVQGDTVSVIAAESPSVDLGNKAAKRCDSVDVKNLVQLSGTHAKYYTIASATAAVTIEKKPITQGSLNKGNLTVMKVYDGTTDAASSATGSLTSTDVIGPDVVTITGTPGAYQYKDAAENQTITISNLQLSGADKDNYSVDGAATYSLTTAAEGNRTSPSRLAGPAKVRPLRGFLLLVPDLPDPRHRQLH